MDRASYSAIGGLEGYVGHRHTGLRDIKSSSMVYMELFRDMGRRVSRAYGYVFRVIY